MPDKQLSKPEIKQVFYQLGNPTDRYGKLLDAWRSAGYPNTEPALVKLLTSQGYTRGQVQQVLNGYPDVAGHSEQAVKLIHSLYKHIVDNNLADEVRTEMQARYGFGQPQPKKGRMGYDIIKNLFKKISEEDLHAPPEQMVALGRQSKYNSCCDTDEVLSEEQYQALLHELDRRLMNRLSASRIKRRVMKSWRRGMHRRTHYDDILRKVDLSLRDLV